VRGYDLPGALTISSGMLLLVLSVVRAPQAGWTSWQTLGGFALAATLLGSFVAIEQRSSHPLVRLGVFRTPGLILANVVAMAVFGCYVAFQFIATLYLQDGLGWSALAMAFGLLPAGLVVAFGSPHTNKLIDRLGTTRVIILGMLAFTAGYVLFLRVGPTMSYPVVLLPTMVLLGIGFALCFPAVNVAATSGVADGEQGLASGLVNTSFQIGGALMLAVVTAVITSGVAASGATPGSIDALLDGYVPGLRLIAAASGVGLVVAATGLIRRRRATVLEACEDMVTAGAAAVSPPLREAA
jgi:predicted MFS family arabinose efflux permease